MTDAALPRVTFALIAYNQAPYLDAAIASALAQDYPNLEVILSDDCSTDETFSIMTAVAAEYGGPHTIVLNRNPRNLHIGGHINAINKLATGKLIVIAAGDDISEPQRTRTLVEAWICAKKLPALIHSDCWRLTGKQKVRFNCQRPDLLRTVEQAANGLSTLIGATEAWDPSLWDCFGDFRSGLVFEDHALVFRSLLLRRPVLHVPEPLVTYRQGSGISTGYVFGRPGPDQRRLALTRHLELVLQKQDDLSRRPMPDILKTLRRAEDQYRAAIHFEEAIPNVKETIAWVRRLGPLHVARLIARGVRDRWQDKRAK